MSCSGQSGGAKRVDIFRGIFYLVVLVSAWRGLVSPFVEQYYYLAGGSVPLLGALEGALELSTMLPPLLGLLAIRRLGLWHAIVLSTLLDLAGLGLLLSGSPPLVLASIAVWSLSRMRTPAIKSAIAHVSERRGQAFGLVETATGVASAACPALASLALVALGTLTGLRLLTAVALALSFASLLVAVSGLRGLAYLARGSGGSARQHLRALKRGLRALRAPLLAFVLLEGVEGLGYLYPIVAVDYGCEPWLWGLAVSASVFVSTPAPVLAGRLLDEASDKAAPVRAFMACLALLFACSFALPSYFWALYVAVVFCGTALHALANAYVAYTCGAGEREEVYAALDSLGAAAASLVAPVAGLIYAAHRASIFLVGAASASIAAALLREPADSN